MPDLNQYSTRTALKEVKLVNFSSSCQILKNDLKKSQIFANVPQFEPKPGMYVAQDEKRMSGLAPKWIRWTIKWDKSGTFFGKSPRWFW